MSHCAPEATLRPIRLKLTPETVVSNVLVTQVCWKAVSNTWPGNSKVPVAKCVATFKICTHSLSHNLDIDMILQNRTND